MIVVVIIDIFFLVVENFLRGEYYLVFPAHVVDGVYEDDCCVGCIPEVGVPGSPLVAFVLEGGKVDLEMPVGEEAHSCTERDPDALVGINWEMECKVYQHVLALGSGVLMEIHLL